MNFEPTKVTNGNHNPNADQASVRPDNLTPTRILDFDHPRVQLLVESLRGSTIDSRSLLQKAHGVIQKSVRSVYTLDELQPVSRTLERGAGSCSQRIACLEAVARAVGVATRARALWIDGAFWNPRFRGVVPFLIPRRILLAWPQFFLEGAWVDFDELFGTSSALLSRATGRFLNNGESIFDAVQHTPVDLFGKTQYCDSNCASEYDLSRYVLRDEGVFESRDALFSAFPLVRDSCRGCVFEVVWGGRKSA